MPGDSKIFQRKLEIERDANLSHGAARLGLVVCSYVYNNWRTILADEPFPLPWTLCSQLCFGMTKRVVYRHLRELVTRGHMAYEGIKGCPGKAHFRLLISVAKNGNPSCAKNGNPSNVTVGNPSGAICDNPSTAKKRTPLNNYFPSEEILDSSGRNSRAGEQIGSLRSKETRGKELAAAPAGTGGAQVGSLRSKGNVPVTERLDHWQAAKQAAGLSHSAMPKKNSR